MKVFRDDLSPDPQMFLLPPTVGEFVPDDAPVRLLTKVVDRLDLYEFYRAYPGGGRPAFDPRMLVKIWLFALTQGMRSSRRIEEALGYDLRFMFLARMSRPDHVTLCRFRKRNVKAIRALFVEVVRLCQQEGLVLLEETALDGTKLQANVSRKQTYRGERLQATIEQIDARIGEMLAEADATDSAQDREERVEQRSTEHRAAVQRSLPLEDGETASAALADGGDPADRAEPLGRVVSTKNENKELNALKRRKKQLEQAKAQQEQTGRSSVPATDLQSRTMRTTDGPKAAYNGQALVDSHSQVIIAAAVTQEETDRAQLPPLLDQAIENAGMKPGRLLADTGYQSDVALLALDRHQVDGYVKQPSDRAQSAAQASQPSLKETCRYDAARDVYITPEGVELTFRRIRVNHGVRHRVYQSRGRRGRQITIREDEGRLQQMRAKLQTPQGKQIYRRRQQIVEPVFAHMKEQLGLRRLYLRGLNGATNEFLLACTTHNVLKLMRTRRSRSVALIAYRGRHTASIRTMRTTHGSFIAWPPTCSPRNRTRRII